MVGFDSSPQRAQASGSNAHLLSLEVDAVVEAVHPVLDRRAAPAHAAPFEPQSRAFFFQMASTLVIDAHKMPTKWLQERINGSNNAPGITLEGSFVARSSHAFRVYGRRA